MKNNKIKILFLDHTPFIGGAQLSLIQHLEEINQDKFSVIVACSKSAGKLGLSRQYDRLGIRYYILSFGRLKLIKPVVLLRYFKSIIEVRRLIKGENINLLVSNTVRTALIGSVVALLGRVKTIWFIRDFTFPKLLFAVFSVIPDKIVFNSRATALYYKKYLSNLSKKTIVYIGRNFYKKIQQLDQADIDKQRQAWSVKQETFFIGYVGRLVEWKGPQILIKAVDLLIKNGAGNIKCIIIGAGSGQEGNNDEALRKMVNLLGLEKYVVFFGHQSDLSVILPSLDVLVLPSIEAEPFSSTVVDAMMAKVAVIGTNTGGTPEIIKDQITGLLVEPADCKNLAQAIKTLINNDDLRKKMIARAYNNVMKHHQASCTSRQLEKIYSAVVAK